MKVFLHCVLAALLQLTVTFSSSFVAHAAKNGSAARSLEEKETYIVTFDNKEDRQEFVDSHSFGEIKSVFARGNSISIDLDTSEYAELQKNTLISNIAIDEIIQLPPFVPTGAGLSSNITSQDTEVSSTINPLEVPYGINLVNALDVSDEFTGDMTVCVCDTGFDLGHPDLQVDKVNGMSFVNETWYIDGDGHGTHVTGTIAAIHNDFGVVGVVRSGKMNILVAQVLNSDGAGSLTSILNGIAWCAVNGANVINLSLGGILSWSNVHLIQVLQDMFEEVVNFDDVLVVSSAGNTGVNSVGYPAMLPGVVSVGAVDENKQLATFSTTNYDVELAAPGVNVISTIPTSFGQLFASYSGTSMACPHVAGVAALVWSHFPWISAKTLREVLIQSATDLGDDGRDERFGFGLVDAKAAYDLLASGYTSGPSAEPSSSMSPSQSSSPSSEPSTSIAPSTSKSPTSAPTPCDGEFLEVIVQTDTKGNETNWNIAEWLSPLTIGKEILSGGKYPKNEQIVDHQSICLPSCKDDPMSSLYRFILNDDWSDGGASYSILLNGKPIIQSASNTYTSLMFSKFSTCGNGVFSATLATNPTMALTAVDEMTTSTSKSPKSSRAKYSVALEPYNATDPRQFWIKTNHGYLMNFYTWQCLQHHRGTLVMRECKEERYHLSQSFVLSDDQTIMSLTASNPAIAVDASDSSLVFEEYLSLGNGPHASNLWNIQKFLRVFYA